MNIEAVRQQAKDETTAAEILLDLVARSDDYLTRQYVAANPNTPTEVLLYISLEFPQEVMDNPVVPLLLLENTNLFPYEAKFYYDYIISLIDIERKRLGWTKEQERNYLKKNYRKRSRQLLSNKEILDYLNTLRKLK